MQTTEHYELNLAEGTDTVNPLVIDVPNYETIDEAMYTNYLGTVGTATELLSGSVHALTRVGATPMFRFTATADWTAGDTVTVDGTQVTAKLPTGAALGTGAYVINSEVLCCLQGTLLTVYVPAGSVTTADDSLKLGGQLPEYYGTASAVQTATNVANAASLLVDQLSSNLITNEINVPTSAWLSDSTSSDYGYKATISSTLYSNNFVPQYVDLIPYDGSAFFSEGENNAKGILNPNIVINASGVTFYASAVPSVALKFRIGGQA